MISCENGFDWTCIVSLIQAGEFWYTVFLFFILPTVFGILFLRFVFRKEYRLYKNLKRKIAVIVPDGASDDEKMDYEMKLLKRAGYFCIEEPCLFNAIEWDRDYGMVVLGYKTGNADALKKVVDRIGGEFPLMIYTYGDYGALGAEEKKILKDNLLYIVANIPLNFVNGVFTTLAVYKYGKSK